MRSDAPVLLMFRRPLDYLLQGCQIPPPPKPPAAEPKEGEGPSAGLSRNGAMSTSVYGSQQGSTKWRPPPPRKVPRPLLPFVELHSGGGLYPALQKDADTRNASSSGSSFPKHVSGPRFS